MHFIALWSFISFGCFYFEFNKYGQHVSLRIPHLLHGEEAINNYLLAYISIIIISISI